MYWLAVPGTIDQWYRLIWNARAIGYSTTSENRMNPGARNVYAASVSFRFEDCTVRPPRRSAAALRPRRPVEEVLLEEAVNLLCGVVERLLDGLAAGERLGDLGLEDLVDLRPLRRRSPRLRGRDLLQVGRVVRVDLDEALRRRLEYRHLPRPRHLRLRVRVEHEPHELRGCRLVLRRLRHDDVLTTDDA